MNRCKSSHTLHNEIVYLVLLEFPPEDKNDENLAWLLTSRSEVEEFCNEYCFKVGALHILPKPYFPIVDSLLSKAKIEYRKRGYSPTFKFLQVNLQDADYLDLQRLILNRIQSRLEVSLSKLEDEGIDDGLLFSALKEVTRANEHTLIFQLSKAYPREVTRVYDLIGILNEKVSEFKLHKSKEVVVTEL